ncbi:BlaI/MecI/CopY family transcriptional regulator [Maledivibacter halophilus]|uniref:BlaI family transcriptional regulator, penicillinase repressor n=1 Tax=Maledivibacter halophilus TaxID=36842 RepID=A0A1T5M9P2_9FIRM|nr:BlaI/MecI/CopY family transcriptional regulator [Maledivibacter halophilus]SKC84947.1 BlaI family transcriptional regulator, penicillinase repressor [Maledivibacter halophilus]
MNIPRISESEWEIMKIIWKYNPITSEKIVLFLQGKVSWSEQTIKTFINRLVKKGAIGFEKSGRQYLYYPLISQKKCVKEESKSFLDRVFNGAIGMMMSNFLEEARLSDEEIEKLKKILEEKHGKDK